MNQREIRLLWEVATTGSVTKAAERVHMTQPSASAAIRALEQRLGFALFTREKRRLELTPKGRTLLPELSNTLAALSSLNQLAGELRTDASHRITIGCVGQAAGTILPLALARLREAMPQERIVIHTALGSDIAAMVADQRLDFGLYLGEAIPSGAGTADIATLGLHAVMLPGCELARHDIVTLEQLSGQRYITLSRQLPIGALVARRFEEKGLPYLPAVEVTQYSSACAFTEVGYGISILDGLCMLMSRKMGLTDRPLQVAKTIPLRLVWPRGSAVARYATAFQEALIDVARGL